MLYSHFKKWGFLSIWSCLLILISRYYLLVIFCCVIFCCFIFWLKTKEWWIWWTPTHFFPLTLVPLPHITLFYSLDAWRGFLCWSWTPWINISNCLKLKLSSKSIPIQWAVAAPLWQLASYNDARVIKKYATFWYSASRLILIYVI